MPLVTHETTTKFEPF